MATKDEKPGLLSKVAMFVRNPTRDWSELDQPADNEATAYDKQALKAMIERKRQNDFVRKREFDQLRKLRNRDPATLASMARPSFFQSSVSTDIDGRAVTLKKIDEIEAQMSRQWWKARAQDSQSPPAAAPASGRESVSDNPNNEPKPSLAPSDMSVAFASTEVMPVPEGDEEDNEFAPTRMTTDEASLSYASQNSGREGKSDSGTGFSPSTLFDANEMATDPELEEAAIRFANGDVAGAENGLLSALRGNDLEPDAAQSWAAALLDLYRATGNRESFDNAANEFALQLDGVWPVWKASTDGDTQSLKDGEAQTVQSTPIWESPAVLTGAGMENLRAALVGSPMPWHLNWSQMQTIEPDAMPLLGALFESLCTEAVSLRLDGQDQLVRTLRALTPSGEGKVDPAWWQVRLNALRALGLQDDFELAALDYCITFEAAPPEWTAAECKVLTAAEASSLAAAAGPARKALETAEVAASASLELSGEILGDATQALATLDSTPTSTKHIAIDCGPLVRVDFAAAGSILNWVTARQAEGKLIQFLNVHRLVAAFFNVIGINEYAKVIPRAL
jgi:ABC-type transporter Mla MlaB component